MLIQELRRESGSHLHMRWHGFSQTTSLGDLAQMLTAQRVVNLLRKEGTADFEFPVPWNRPDPNADVTPEMRADLEARLDAVSAFPGFVG